MKKISLLFVFVMLFVMLFAFNAFAATQKNVASEAQLTQTDSTSALVTQDALEKLRDGNYNTAATCGDAGKTWINYHFLYNKGTTVSKIFIVVNSSGENFYESKDADGNLQTGVYEDLTENDFNLYVRLYDAKNNVVWKKEAFSIKEAEAVEDSEGNTLYTAFTFIYDKPYTDIHKVEVAANSKVRVAYECVWEVEIYDYNCVDEDEHSWTAATCEAPAVCKYCKATTGTTDANNHTSIQADDGNCTTPVKCTACDTEIVPAYIHRFSIDANTCLNDGCKESIFEDNIANLATISVNPNEVWWACKTELLVDGNWSTATFAPMNKGYGISSYSYIFNYAEAQYLTRFVVAVNGEKLNTPDGYKEAKTDAVKNVVIKLYNQVNGEKVLVYESERFNFTDDANEAVLELPYALQVTEAEFAFNTSASWGSSFVREIEIYKPKSIETNIASVGNPVAGGGEVWWAVGPEYIIDGDKSTATHSPKSNNFTYTFDYGKTLLLSKAIVVANGECRTEKKVGDSDASGPQNSNSIQNVIITLYNKSGQVVYESDRYEFTEGVTEIVIQFPYTYQASKVVATFNSTAAYGSSFVREIEIYKTVLPNFPEGGVELDEVDFDGCWKKIKLKDAIEEAIYYKPEEGNNRGGHYYAVDEDGNYILDENGNAIFLTGAPVGGNSNGYGSEMDGVKETGLGIFYEGQNNGIQYNFNKQYLIKDITITYRAYCKGPEDGYDLWVGKIVNGEEVWEQVASYTASEAGYSTVKFELGEDREGVEGSMFRFYWRASQTERLTPTLTEVDMTIYENRCDWKETNVLSQANCGYDRVAECECARCGFEKTIVTEAASCEHQLSVYVDAKAATCTDFGYNAVKKCAKCDRTYGGDRIAKILGHKKGTAATCTDAAVCSVCNESYGDPLGHNPNREAADCVNDKVCSRCKVVLEPKLGHTEGTAATCTEAAVCATCGESYGDSLGHDLNEATCTTPASCSRCDYEGANPLGHKEGTAATCTSKAVCSVCSQEYGEYADHKLTDLKCSVCNKYVVTTLDELKSAMNKCSSTEKETIVLGDDIKPGYGTNNFFEIVKPITLDFAGHTLEIGAYQNGIRLNHPECALISSVGTGTFNFVGNVAAVKLFNADTIQNININVKTLTQENKITGISIQLAKGATSAHVNSIKNVRIEGQGLSVGFETYQCGGNADLVINEMENVYINATYNGKAGKNFEIIGMTLQAPCGTFTNCTVTSAEEGVRFRASANWSMTGEFINCQVTGDTHGLNMYSDGNISSTAVLAFKSDANTTFTCTSDPEKSFTAALNGAIDNIEVEISGVKMVAYINGQFYGSFEEAYAVVPDGGTLQILADVELVDSLVIDKKITLDLNKYTVSAPNGKAGDGVFHVIAGGELTITGNGTINGVCANKDGYHMAIWADGGSVVINGGTFTNVGENLTDDQYDLIYAKNGGSVVINGGTFIAQTPKWTLNIHGTNTGTIVVNGGKFYAYNPSASESESPVANFVADNKCAVLNDKGYYDVIDHVKGGEWLYDAENYKMVKTCVNCSKVMEKTAVVAKINGIGYASLEAAVAVGGEITLEANIDLATAVEINNIVTINLNGKTLTVSKDTEGNGVFWVKEGGVLTINGEGTVNGVGNNNYNIAIWANGGSVVINGGTYTNVGENLTDDHYDLIYAKNGGSVVINGGTFIAQTPKWTLNACDKTGGSFVVTGGTFPAGFNPGATGNEPAGVVDDYIPYDYYLNAEGVVVSCGHSYVESTCTEDGYCSLCGRPNEADPAKGHRYELDCNKDCAVCHEITRPEADHAIVHVAAKAPTCTAMGNLEFWYCEVCGGAWLDEALIRNTNLRAVKLPETGHTNTEIIPAVLPLPSNNHTGMTEGLYCLDCDTVVEEQVEFTVGTSTDANFKINSATLALGEDISIVYDATHPANSSADSMYMVFILNGKETVVSKKTIVSGNRYSFKFTGMKAQFMADNVEAYVYAIENGNYVMKSHLQYSVKQYCVNQLKKSTTSDGDRQVIYAVLNLGDCVQKFGNPNIAEDKLITSIVAAEIGSTIPKTSVDTVDYTSVQAVLGDRTKGYDWKSGTLSMGNAVKLSIDFTATSLEGLVLKFNVGGDREIEIDASEAEPVKGYTNRYNVEFQVKVLEYADTVTCTFEKNGEQVGSTLTYSVYTYIVRCYQNAKDFSEEERNFMKAIYAYGEAVKANSKK